MGHKILLAALGMIAAASPAPATQPEPMLAEGAPIAAPDAKYCLRVEPVTGSRIETILCETRAEWIELGVDIDKDWAKEGVRVLG